jgi:small GTP-binding protein
MSETPVIKVFFAGEGGIGKSTMVERIVTGKFNDSLILTIGVNHSIKNMKTSDGRDVTLQIWDIGGEDRFRFVVQSYVKGSTAGVIGFDATRMSTYLRLTHWLDIIREILPATPIFLVGMKSDLEESSHAFEDYSDILQKYNLKELIFTSSKTGHNVEYTLTKMADCLPQVPQFYRKTEN